MPSQPALDPVLYARVISLMKQDCRFEAITAVEDELGLAHSAAADYLNALWSAYQAGRPARPPAPLLSRYALAGLATFGALSVLVFERLLLH